MTFKMLTLTFVSLFLFAHSQQVPGTAAVSNAINQASSILPRYSDCPKECQADYVLAAGSCSKLTHSRCTVVPCPLSDSVVGFACMEKGDVPEGPKLPNPFVFPQFPSPLELATPPRIDAIPSVPQAIQFATSLPGQLGVPVPGPVAAQLQNIATLSQIPPAQLIQQIPGAPAVLSNPYTQQILSNPIVQQTLSNPIVQQLAQGKVPDPRLTKCPEQCRTDFLVVETSCTSVTHAGCRVVACDLEDGQFGFQCVSVLAPPETDDATPPAAAAADGGN